MPGDTIVKIQKALYPVTGPALIYDRARTLIIHEPLGRLPPEVRTALSNTGKVYWRVRLAGGDLAYVGRAPHQSW